MNDAGVKRKGPSADREVVRVGKLWFDPPLARGSRENADSSRSQR